MDNPLQAVDPEIYDAVCRDLHRQLTRIDLIAAENYTSAAVMIATGSVMTNKYAEGYYGARYYGGCEFVDVAERLAIERAKQIFGAEHANVQPHCGTQANMAVYFAFLRPGDTLMALDLAHGGHLSHGAPKSFCGALYNVVPYGVSRETETIDMDQVRELAQRHRPKLIVTGASSYPRFIDFQRFAEVAREVGAYLMADVAHPAGLIAAGLHPTPVPYADFVTATTHKTMRGPRGGIIMCKKEYAAKVDAQVFPGIQGGPLMHTIAGKAVALKEALEPDFADYQAQILANCQAMLRELQDRGYRIVTGGSDNHLFLVDLRNIGITGRLACQLLDEAGITLNQNLIPFDPRSAREASGIRIGTPAVTTRGMKEPEMFLIADWIDRVLRRPDDAALRARIRPEVEELCLQFPIYPGLSGIFLPELAERVGA
ncbi:MAG: serine hydroxymethyltransferase [Planctomycetes bacterium]|nr:serine hydroxymethyltransferase [Planctomycetota bacterium]